jgi:hypothetical protein
MVANVREHFRQEYPYVYFDDINDSFIEEYLSHSYIVSLSFKMQMNYLYDAVMSQAMVDYDE